MGKVDWENAPDWADRVLKSLTGVLIFSDGVNFSGSDGIKYEHGEVINILPDGHEILAFKYDSCRLIELRPDEWKKGAERMEQIAQNGNGGEVYAELDDYTKQPRYKGEDGLDWIDEFARDNTIEDFRAAMRFTIGKYEKRLGKKDAISKELYKMSDYYKRWSEVEKKLEQEKGE